MKKCPDDHLKPFSMDSEAKTCPVCNQLLVEVEQA